MDIDIRPLTIASYEDILRVWTSAGLPIKPNGRDSREMVAAEMERDYSTFLGAYRDERLIGVAIVEFDSRRGWINRMAVEKRYQGKGIASRLVTACTEWLLRFGDRLQVNALIEENNMPSGACFAKAGFHRQDSVTYWTKRPRKDL